MSIHVVLLFLPLPEIWIPSKDSEAIKQLQLPMDSRGHHCHHAWPNPLVGLVLSDECMSIYIYIHNYIYTHIHIYIYTLERGREGERESPARNHDVSLFVLGHVFR